jgi:hypothetical protein
MQLRFWTKYHTEPPTDKRIHEWYKKFQQSGCLCAVKQTGWLGPLDEAVKRVQPVSFCGKTFVQNVPDTWLRHLQFPARMICWLLRAPDKRFSHILNSLGWWPRPAYSFHSTQAATLLEFLVPLMNYFVHWWFCVVLGPKPPLHYHKWLSFGKFQDTERFPLPCSCHVLPWLPPSSETCKYAMAPFTQTNLERFSTYWYPPFCSVCLGCCISEFGSSEGTYELPCTYCEYKTIM